MDVWTIIEKSQYPEKFSGVVHHDEGANNFSVKISTILHSNVYKKISQFKSFTRLPYVCIYFENVVVIFSTFKCEDVILLKTFDSSICGLILQQASDKLVAILENGILHTVDILTKEHNYSRTCIADEKFPNLMMFEQENGSIILASTTFMYYSITILDEDVVNNELKFKMCRMKLSELDDNTLLKTELLQKNVKSIAGSALYLKISPASDLNAFCPISHQKVQIGENIKAASIQPFLNSDKVLVLKRNLINNSYNLCVTNLSSYETEFNVKVSENCFIISGVNDTAVYLDMTDESLCIYQIQENSPLSQLEILISSRNYEEAEAFAKLHNLSRESVLELKAKFLLSSLKKAVSSEGIAELQEVLSSCNNVDFIVHCCIEGAESNENLSSLLQFVKKYLIEFNDDIIKARIDELIWKTDVFVMLRYEDVDNVMEWKDFINEHPLSLCKKLLCNDQMDHACIVWMKCYPYIAHKLKSNDVYELLSAVSPDVSIKSLLLWLENFIPGAVNVLPHATDIIVNWAQDRVCCLENTKCWPEIGIQLAEKFSSIIFQVKVTINFIPTSAEKFYNLLYCLKNIQILKSAYNIVISLKDYMTLSSSELAKLILRKAFTEDLGLLLSDFIDKFVIKHAINNDVLIREHIEELLSISPVIDENKMEILLEYIHRTEERMNCVLLVLKSASIPWTEKIAKIAEKAIESKHVLASNVRMEVLHAEIRSILMKYKCHELLSEDYEYLIRLIVKKGDKDMMYDIDKITGFYYSLKDDAYMLCIQRYITCSEVHTALKLFHSMKECFQMMCINSILLKLEKLLISGTNTEAEEYNYLDFLKSVDLVSDTTLKYLNNVYELKTRFKLSITLTDYCIESYRKFFFRDWCRDKNNRSSKNICALLTKTCQIGECLMIPKSESISILLEHLNSDSQKSVANIIFSQNLCFLSNTIKSLDLILQLIPMIDVFDILVLDNIAQFVLKIMQSCNETYLTYCIDVCSWLFAIRFSHNSTKEMLSTWKISSFYNPHVISSIIPIWRDIFSKNTSTNFSSKNLTICLCKIGHECNDGSKCLKPTLIKLQSQQNDIYFTRISSYYIINHLKNNLPLPNWFVDLNDSMLTNLVPKMFMVDQPDHLLISILIFSHSNPGEWLTDVLLKCFDTHRKISVAQYILKCKEMFYGISIPYNQAFSIYSQNNISCKLENYGVIYKECQQDNAYNVDLLLESLVNIKTFNISIIEELCTVTNSSLDNALMYYLFSVLKNWDSEYEILQDDFGNCYVHAKTTNSDLMQTCLTIVQNITCKNVLKDNLSTLFLQGEINLRTPTTITLSQYCYEVYLFILKLLKNVSDNQMFSREYLLLKFLQTYQRVSKPKQSELDVYSMKETFPKIGYIRLPFQCLVSSDVWHNLKPEVTLSTYGRWLSIASLLPLNVELQVRHDMICSNAVRQSMTTEKSKNEAANMKWSLHLKNDHLLRQAYECIQNITNLEWAGACFYHVFQGSMFGADQVAAADLCYQFAEHWSQLEPDEKVVKKMQSKHLLTSTVHVLHKIGLAEDNLLPLSDNIRALINALYHHDKILKSYECYDINLAVDEICEKNGLNAASERMSILEKILNETNNVGIKSQYVDDGTLKRETLAKACYILKGTNPMMAALYLSRIGLDECYTTDNYISKIRALQCLLSLVETDVIEKVTNFTVVELWSKLWELYFINCLHMSGLEFLTSIFLEDRKQAIEQIWHAREHNHFVISFIIKMIFVYNLQLEDNLFSEILQGMLKFDMSHQMREFLQSIKLFYGDNYVEAWKNVLLNPFKRLDTPLVGNQKEECYDTLKILPTCPITAQIDLSPIWLNLIRLGNSDMAAMVLPHVNTGEQKKLISKLGKIQSSYLQKIKTFKSKGIVTTNTVMAILKRDYVRSK